MERRYQYGFLSLVNLLLCLAAIAVLTRCGSPRNIPPLTISPSALPNGTAGTPYSQMLQPGGGVGPYTWTVNGAMPHNLQLTAGGNTATISGTPDTPVQAQAFSVRLADSGGHSASQPYTLSILAEPDTLTLSPASMTFSPQLVGTVSSQGTTLSNSGASPVFIASVAASGDFTQSNDCASSVATGASCTINVSFAPTQPGPGSGQVTVMDSTLGSPHVLPLSGIGLSAGPNGTLSASSLDFGNELVGTTSPALSITLSNYGSMTLNIASITVTTNFGETDNCGATVVSGANCTLNVTFSPTATGSVSGTLSITDNDPASPQMVSLSGTGTQYTLTGYCLGILSGTNLCVRNKDTASCPAGIAAIRPTQSQCVNGVASVVDDARACGQHTNAPGLCEAH